MSDCAEVHAGLVRGNQERPNSMADFGKAGFLDIELENEAVRVLLIVLTGSSSCYLEWGFQLSMSALATKATILMTAHRRRLKETMHTLKAGDTVWLSKYHTCW